MGGLSPSQRAAQIAQSVATNFDSSKKDVGTPAPGGAFGIGGFGGPRDTSTQSHAIDTSSPAGQALYTAYVKSGVGFDAQGRIISNPADLGAAQAAAYSKSIGAPISVSFPNSELQARKNEYDQRRRQSSLQSSLNELRQNQGDLDAQISDTQKTLNDLTAYQQTREGGKGGADLSVIATRKSLAQLQTQKESLGANIQNVGNSINNIGSQILKSSAINNLLPSASAQKSGVSAGIKSITPPLKNRELSGTTITADFLKGNQKEINQKELFNRVTNAPDALTAFGYQKGAQAKGEGTTQFYQEPDGSIRDPFGAGGFMGYNAEKVAQAKIDGGFGVGKNPLRGTNFSGITQVSPKSAPAIQSQLNYQQSINKRPISTVLSGNVPVSIAPIKETADKLLDINPSIPNEPLTSFASVSAPKPTKSVSLELFDGLDITDSRVQTPATGKTAIGSLVGENVLIGPPVPEGIKSKIPKVDTLALLAGEIGISKNKVIRSFLPYSVTKDLPREKPNERRDGSDLDYLAGFTAPFENLKNNILDYATGNFKVTQKEKGIDFTRTSNPFGLPQIEFNTPQKPGVIDSGLSGLPSGQSRAYEKGNILGEFAMATLTNEAGNGLGLVRGAIGGAKTNIGNKIGELNINPIKQTYQLDSGAPISIEKTPGGAFELFRSQEEPRIKISPKLEPATIKIKPDLTEQGITTQKRNTPNMPSFEINTNLSPKKVNIPEPYKNPQPKVPYAYIEPRGTIAEILKEPLKGPRVEIGKIISAPKGALSEPEVARLGLIKHQTSPTSPLDIYSVKTSDSINKILEDATNAGYLKKITDVRLGSTSESAKQSRNALKTIRKENDLAIRNSVRRAAGKNGIGAKDYLAALAGNVKLNFREPLTEQSNKPLIPKYTAKEAIQNYKAVPDTIKFFRKRIQNPTTIGYYEMGNIGLEIPTGRELGAKISQTRLKGFAQNGVNSFETGSKGLEKIFENAGLSNGKKTFGRTNKSLRPFDQFYFKEDKGIAGGKGKAQRLLTKEDENLLRGVINDLGKAKNGKKRRIIPAGPTGLIGIQGKRKKSEQEYSETKYTEPIGIVGYTPEINSRQILDELLRENRKQKRQNKLVGILGVIPERNRLGILGQIPSNKKRQKTIAESSGSIRPHSPYGGIVIEKINPELEYDKREKRNSLIPIITPRSRISQIPNSRDRFRPSLNQPLLQTPLTRIRLTPSSILTPNQITTPKLTPGLTTITTTKTTTTTRPPPTRTPPELTFGRGFPLFPYGGYGGDSKRGSRRNRKFVVQNISQNIAGAFDLAGVPEVQVSSNAGIFTKFDKQISRAERLNTTGRAPKPFKFLEFKGPKKTRRSKNNSIGSMLSLKNLKI